MNLQNDTTFRNNHYLTATTLHALNTTRGQRIGLLGGSFNPPHNAHLNLALAAQAQLGLDRVDFMPAGMPWQKAGLVMASARHRLALCAALISDYSQLSVEPIETERSGHTYTVETLLALRVKNPNANYTLIIGSDQANALNTWHRWQALLGLCTLAVVARNGASIHWQPDVAQVLADLGTAPTQIVLPASAISSSEIRSRLVRGESVAQFVPPAVAGYIAKYSLYS